jgi:UDP-N-acetylglucosamine 2-epimerase
MSYCDCVIGNSSSGIIEAPALNVPTINIGERQKGRLMAESVITCAPELNQILQALNKVEAPDFKKMLNSSSSPYSSFNAVEKIISILETVDLEVIKRKQFYDLQI